MKYRLSIISLIMILLLISGVSAQDTTKVGIENGDAWDFEVTAGSYEYTASGHTMTAGDEYELSVTSDISATGTFDMEIDGPDAIAAGSGDLGQFGNDIVFTDWAHWESEAGGDLDSEFEVTGSATVTNGDSEFKLVWAIDDLISMIFTIVYYKSTGVMKSVEFILEGTTELAIENITGSEAKAPGFGLFLAIIGIIAIPVLRKRNL